MSVCGIDRLRKRGNFEYSTITYFQGIFFHLGGGGGETYMGRNFPQWAHLVYFNQVKQMI